MEDSKGSNPKIALFLGSGFSSEFGLPTTRELNTRLLGPVEETLPGVPNLEEFISTTIREFWERVFGWRTGLPPPSLEDHFTQIDMAANSGHSLGTTYGPSKLRALRRMTIHRVFTLLACDQYAPCETFDKFFQGVRRASSPTFITTNWDQWLERFVGLDDTRFNFGVDELAASGEAARADGYGR